MEEKESPRRKLKAKKNAKALRSGVEVSSVSKFSDS